MVADNDLGLGQIVDLISHSAIWSSSAIFVVEDDSQDGADHVDAHRTPAAVISPYARRGKVISTRYDHLSVIRSIELILGMHPLGLFDALATPMYDAFAQVATNPEPYDALNENVDLLERNATRPRTARCPPGSTWTAASTACRNGSSTRCCGSLSTAHGHSSSPGPNAAHEQEEEGD